MPQRIAVQACCIAWLLVGCFSSSPSAQEFAEPPPFPGSAAATAWRTAEDPPEGYGPGTAGFSSARDVVQSLLDEALGSEEGLPAGARLTGGMLDEGRTSAGAWIYLTGIMDDSAAGTEFRLDIRQAPAGWFIHGLAWRDHCRRAVDRPSDLCV